MIVGAEESEYTLIADIQNNTSGYEDQSVTVIGQVYITGASAGGTPSAYIQDGSGRGLNVYGSGDATALNDRGNVVQVSGSVELYFTTTEITGYTATLVKGDQPFLAPKVRQKLEAANIDIESMEKNLLIWGEVDSPELVNGTKSAWNGHWPIAAAC